MNGDELERYEREDKIWELSVKGWSDRKIAAEVGLSHTMVGKIKNARLQGMVTPHVETYRAIETERLNKLVELFTPKAEAGEYGAATVLLKVSERMAKLWALDMSAGASPIAGQSPWEQIIKGEVVQDEPMDYSKLSEDDLWQLLKKKQQQRAIESGEP